MSQGANDAVKEEMNVDVKGEADDEYVDEPLPLESKARDEGQGDDYMADDFDIEPTGASSSRKRRRTTNTDKGSYQVNNIENELEQSMKLFNKIKDMKDDTGRPLSSEFINLPNGQLLPDYYTVIKKPISFQQIEERITKKEYVSMLEMKSDFELCFSNAKKYNAKNSQIVVDAKAMLKKVKECFQKYCEHGDVDGGPEPNESGFPFPQQKSKRGRPKGINKIVKKVIDKLMIHRHKDNGRLMSEPFNVLPDEKEVPYYYDVIDNPTSFEIINKNMAEKFYTTISEIVEDLELMFNNAMHFNEESSEIHQDAKELKATMYELLKIHVPDDMLDEKLWRIVMTPDGQRIPSTYVEQKPLPKTKPAFPLKASSNYDFVQFRPERNSVDPAALEAFLKDNQPSPSGTPSKAEAQKKDEEEEIIEAVDPDTDSTHASNMLKLQPSLRAMKFDKSFIDCGMFVDHALTIASQPGLKVEVKTFNKSDTHIDSKNLMLRCNGSMIPLSSSSSSSLPTPQGEHKWFVTLQRKNVIEVFVTHRNSQDRVEATEMYKIFLSAGA
ncbi:hypothetical protein E3P99_01985 [Wallemia hederae]|uniref:Bromo domain-containing protein n=1 Tax=Wallemia hederae TaxID=1540922 RepID=A0A4T0FMM8_9BASI|nr:hypothetical protein E3P99_01985 [Wallemia hederae]